MTLVQFLKHYKIDEIISFHKEEVKNESRVMIGWKASDSLDLSKEIVISKSKSNDQNKKSRITAGNIEEYRKYFLAVSQKTPEDYLREKDSKPTVKGIDDEFVRLLALFLTSKEKINWNKLVTLEILNLKS